MDEMICCQRDIPRDRWRYGLRASRDTGCGWIAVYNALRLLGHYPHPEALIRCFERQLPLIHGNFGTLCLAPALFLKRRGFSVETCSRTDCFDDLVCRSTACILFYYWKKGIKIGAHFVALHRTEQGIFSYNTYSSSSGPDFCGESLQKFLTEKGYFGAILTGIRNP